MHEVVQFITAIEVTAAKARAVSGFTISIFPNDISTFTARNFSVCSRGVWVWSIGVAIAAAFICY